MTTGKTALKLNSLVIDCLLIYCSDFFIFALILKNFNSYVYLKIVQKNYRNIYRKKIQMFFQYFFWYFQMDVIIVFAKEASKKSEKSGLFFHYFFLDFFLMFFSICIAQNNQDYFQKYSEIV